MRIFDVSLPIEPGMPVYPKNPETKFEKIDTGHSTISKLTLGTHTGTHVDSPAHCFSSGSGVDELPLSVFMGPCKVLDFSEIEFGQGIEANHLERKPISKGDRILFLTKNSGRGYTEFYEDYVFLTNDGAKYLAEIEVSLVGIDCLSIKKRGLEDNSAHTKLLEKNIPIIEGLNLSDVTAGEYTFFGFPLKLRGLDGSPLRAVLVSN